MNRIISRMQKIAAESISITDEVKKLPKDKLNAIAKDIASRAKGFAESESQDSFNVLDPEVLEEKFFDGLEDNDLIEAVQDYLDNVSDEQLSNLDKTDLDSLKNLLFEISQIEVGNVINAVIDGMDVDDQDPNENNWPYGPGMKQHDFI